MSPSPLDPHVLSQVAGLSLRVRRLVEGTLAGAHRSPRHGSSIEFAEHRKYTWGDDLRHVDWKAFGRTDRYYLKQFEDETRFTAYVVVDATGSMAYRSSGAPWSKFEASQCLAATLAWLVVMQGDAAGMWAVGSNGPPLLPAVANRDQLRRIVDYLEQIEPSGTMPEGWWIELAERFQHRSLIVVVSDLFDPPGEMIKGLQRLRHAGHDVIVLQTLDPAELTFPFARTARFTSLETGQRLITEPRSIRKAYREEITNFLQEIESTCRGIGIDYQRITTCDPLGKVLAAFLAWRKTKMAW